ncbi:cAMP-binding domain of CRP or a regulatory subunit of cAMP-dependent protein kinases [Hymenobacter gelipurpurascens]|uniref:cAMP-binding domain of CRP or a regulatory subunit of cAMP-dependent protein kinases n=1 Tax=Hymenobacter gelipurpurascens TaxID=89968 RepID=A0A212T668_9BACT|nr:Crp/Fnr family transcriptional regulator [Hymenobacter gelipurpurascens]SNC61326.1 cAMP-binding domain of CRP or a regulatory subunit of cAMP-dependent protein kinases [Hymenobacter gelipurpurascens]
MHPLRAYLHRFIPSLTDADWQPLAQALRPLHLARGEHFVQAGERRHELAILLQGSCRLYYPRPDGEERTTYFFFENHLLGDYPGCLTGQPSQLSIQALTDAELLVFDYAVLRQLYEERPVYERFGRLVAEYHLLGTDARLVEQLMLSPEERYRALLSSGKTKILECIPQHLVANYLGVTPVSLSRIRARVARKPDAKA